MKGSFSTKVKLDLTIDEIRDLCPDNEFRVFPISQIPDGFPTGIIEKSPRFFMATSACMDGIVVTINPYRFDKGDVVDQHPWVGHFKKDGSVFGGLWNHASWPDRTVNLTQEQLQDLSLSATLTFSAFTNQPDKDEGNLSELNSQGKLIYLVAPMEKLREEDEGANY